MATTNLKWLNQNEFTEEVLKASAAGRGEEANRSDQEDQKGRRRCETNSHEKQLQLEPMSESAQNEGQIAETIASYEYAEQDCAIEYAWW